MYLNCCSHVWEQEAREDQTHQVDHQRGLWSAPGLGGNVSELWSGMLRLWRHVLDEGKAGKQNNALRTERIADTGGSYVQKDMNQGSGDQLWPCRNQFKKQHSSEKELRKLR